jgi:hypothetical protein
MKIVDTSYTTYEEAVHSKEYLEYLFELKERNAQYTKVSAGYIKHYREEYSEFESKVNYWVKGVGSSGYMERGYYHPSPIYDLVVGGRKRGRLLNVRDDPSKADILFGFDGCGRLVFIKRDLNTQYEEHELLFYEGNKVLGYTFNLARDDGYLQECVFNDGRLVQFTRFRPTYRLAPNDWMGTDFRREDYSYYKGELALVESVSLLCPFPSILYDEDKDGGVIGRDQCFLKYDETGRFSAFQRIPFWGPFQRGERRDHDWNCIRKKRRLSDFEKKVLSAYKMR